MKYYSVTVLSEALGCSREWIYKLIKHKRVKAEKITGGGDVNVRDPKWPATIPLRGLLLEFANPGEMIFQVRERGKKWQTVKRMPVEKTES